jgi:arachidonate 15-lipoxygenase
MLTMEFLLPQDDSDPARRREGLAARQKEYSFTNFNGLPIGADFHDRDKAGPMWVKQLLSLIHASRENLEAYLDASGLSFSNPLPKRTITELGAALGRKDFTTLLNHYLPEMGCATSGGRARSIEEYRRVFQKEPLPRIADVFMEDWVFARSFVAGANPLLLRRLDAPRAQLPVSDDHFRRTRELRDDSLGRAIGEGRVFVVDYAVIDRLRSGAHPQRPKYVIHPRVMLALPRGQTALTPVAIGAGQTASDPIWTPSDGWAWQMAKQAVRAADGCHQELLSHLAYTHLVIEAFVVATRRQLSESHPIYALLDPHFEGTMPINALAVKKLIQPGEAVDRLLGADVPSIYALLERERLSFDFAARHVPVELAARGVIDIPEYPYRDDALAIWNAIHRWVSGYVDHYYANDEAVTRDEELQAWAKELVDPGQGAVRGLGRGGELGDAATLKDALTMIVFTASAQHAAANFSQKTEMAFSPAHPLAGYAPLPAPGDAVSERDFFEMLPPLDVALRTEQTMIFLGSLHHGELGRYGVLHFRDSEIISLMKRFQRELGEIESAIVARNQGMILPYVHLQPSRIPQSINI